MRYVEICEEDGYMKLKVKDELVYLKLEYTSSYTLYYYDNNKNPVQLEDLSKLLQITFEALTLFLNSNTYGRINSLVSHLISTEETDSTLATTCKLFKELYHRLCHSIPIYEKRHVIHMIPMNPTNSDKLSNIRYEKDGLGRDVLYSVIDKNHVMYTRLTDTSTAYTSWYHHVYIQDEYTLVSASFNTSDYMPKELTNPIFWNLKRELSTLPNIDHVPYEMLKRLMKILTTFKCSLSKYLAHWEIKDVFYVHQLCNTRVSLIRERVKLLSISDVTDIKYLIKCGELIKSVIDTHIKFEPESNSVGELLGDIINTTRHYSRGAKYCKFNREFHFDKAYYDSFIQFLGDTMDNHTHPYECLTLGFKNFAKLQTTEYGVPYLKPFKYKSDTLECEYYLPSDRDLYLRLSELTTSYCINDLLLTEVIQNTATQILIVNGTVVTICLAKDGTLLLGDTVDMLSESTIEELIDLLIKQINVRITNIYRTPRHYNMEHENKRDIKDTLTVIGNGKSRYKRYIHTVIEYTRG